MTVRLKSAIKPFLPWCIVRLSSRSQARRLRRGNAAKSLAQVFGTAYRLNEWGGTPGQYFSGSGSADPSVLEYARTIRGFIASHNITTVVDLGCGDFRVGNQIQTPGVRYIGVDIVRDLVERNQALYGTDNRTFRCIDICKDELPRGELCLIRQVLQHLSNEEIKQILQNVRAFRYVIVTEHYLPTRMAVVYNRDKPHGADTRLCDRSGVYLDRPPFSIPVKQVLLDTELRIPQLYKGERLTTFLIEGE